MNPNGIDSLFLYGTAANGNHSEYELGALWELVQQEEVNYHIEQNSFIGHFTLKRYCIMTIR